MLNDDSLSIDVSVTGDPKRKNKESIGTETGACNLPYILYIIYSISHK